MKGLCVRLVALFTLLLVFHSTRCFAYSVLTHEAIVDVNWNKVLVPLLKQKFPSATAEELKNAHAFAYGGCVMPDLGYYPFGSKLFTNLVHYARSGDFIENLFAEAGNLNEYAFALGVLCHYYADKYGHSVGVNRSVPLIYPEMRTKFGDTVTYADDKISHLRTEFSFDVLQTARGNYASKAYHDFVGFRVPKELIKKAFQRTYGLDVNDLFGDFDRAVGSFRWSVKELIPSATRAAWKLKKKQIRQANPSMTRHSYVYRISRQKYFKEFGRDRDKATLGESILAFLIRIAPKCGPLKILKFRVPGAEAEKMFLESFDETVLNYREKLEASPDRHIELHNIDWDTGKKTMQGEYELADETYSDWIIKLKEKNFATTTPLIKQDILVFYENHSASSTADNETWQQTSAALQELRKNSSTDR